jgi:hypothetical protein
MSAKHTPGPWEVGDAPDDRVAVHGGTVCVAVVGDKGFAAVEADAYLIAAAPELLAALEGLLADPYLSHSINNDRMAPARAAIAKAKGGA